MKGVIWRHLTINEPQRCHNCLYSRTYEVVDPVAPPLFSIETKTAKVFATTDINLVKNDWAFKTQSTITKCHLQGKPEIVNSKLDWCYQWNPSDPCSGELNEN